MVRSDPIKATGSINESTHSHIHTQPNPPKTTHWTTSRRPARAATSKGVRFLPSDSTVTMPASSNTISRTTSLAPARHAWSSASSFIFFCLG